jgi:hypothetical protein
VLLAINVPAGAILLPLQAGAFAGRYRPVRFDTSFVTPNSGLLGGESACFTPRERAVTNSVSNAPGLAMFAPINAGG